MIKIALSAHNNLTRPHSQRFESGGISTDIIINGVLPLEPVIIEDRDYPPRDYEERLAKELVTDRWIEDLVRQYMHDGVLLTMEQAIASNVIVQIPYLVLREPSGKDIANPLAVPALTLMIHEEPDGAFICEDNWMGLLEENVRLIERWRLTRSFGIKEWGWQLDNVLLCSYGDTQDIIAAATGL